MASPTATAPDDGSTASTIQIGALVAGKYRVERVLGHGGMGVVVAARHVVLDQRVALKLLLPAAVGSGHRRERFLREARAAAKLESDHVVGVSDIGELDNGGLFIVMEYLEGSDLSELVAARGPLPVGEAVDHVLEALEGIGDAHARGIVHRDLKPANLFLARRGDGSTSLKVLDFGIAKSTDDESARRDLTTSSVSFMGSPAYMSPEQIRSARDVDARAALWAMGVVLHEVLTGTRPFTADSAGAVFAKILEREPLAPCGVRPDLPADLEAIILRCLRKDPGERFQTASDLAAALAPFGRNPSKSVGRLVTRGRAGAPDAAPSSSARAAAVEAAAASVRTPQTEPRAQARLTYFLAGVLLVLGIGGVGVVLARTGGRAPIAAPTASGAEPAPNQPSPSAARVDGVLPPAPSLPVPAPTASATASAGPPAASAASARPASTTGSGSPPRRPPPATKPARAPAPRGTTTGGVLFGDPG